MRHREKIMRHTDEKQDFGPIGKLFPSRWITLLIVALMVFLLADRTGAAERETSWRIGLEFTWVNPSGDFSTTTGDGNTVRASYDTGFGAGARGEFRFAPQYGVELSAFGAGAIDLSSGTNGSYVRVSTVAPVMVGFNFHLTPDKPVDFYVGPMLGLVRYSDVEFRSNFGTVSATVVIEDDYTWGLMAGLEIPIGRRGWQVQGNLRYIESDLRDSNGPISINTEFDPLILSVGFGYRF
jgi:outer membrane protein W